MDSGTDAGNAQDAGTDAGTDASVGTDACTPTDELCNGMDDDCDGEVDEDMTLADGTGVTLGDACDGTDDDQCPDGVYDCGTDPYHAVCNDDATSTPELCDSTGSTPGDDEDCDGSIDEGFQTTVYDASDGSVETAAETCFACAGRPWTCNPSTGMATCDTSPIPGAEETCDGVDDDCDGMIDESPTDAGGSCTPSGYCGSSIWTCESGSLVCTGGTLEALIMLCDDSDGDCHVDMSSCSMRCPTEQTPGACAEGSGPHVLPPPSSSGLYDCCDTDARAHPGQSDYYLSQNSCSSWDYDCSGAGDRVVASSGTNPDGSVTTTYSWDVDACFICNGDGMFTGWDPFYCTDICPGGCNSDERCTNVVCGGGISSSCGYIDSVGFACGSHTTPSLRVGCH